MLENGAKDLSLLLKGLQIDVADAGSRRVSW